MISYEVYKTLHLFLVVSLFSSIGFIAYDSKVFLAKAGNWIIGILSFLIFAAGMGLVARLGYKHSNPFPLWIKLKIANWVGLNIFFVILFRVKTKEYRAALSLLILLFALTGIWLAIYRPV